MIPYAEEKNDEKDSTVKKTKSKAILFLHKILLNRESKVFIIAITLGILLPVTLYHVYYFGTADVVTDPFSLGSCLLPRSLRLSCGVDVQNAHQCSSHCCYDEQRQFCYHRFPSRFTYILEEEWTQNATFRPRIPTVPFKLQNSIQVIQLSIDEITSTHLSVTFYNPHNTVMEGRKIVDKNYNYNITRPELSLWVRDSLGRNIFDTVQGPIIASENIWEIAFLLTREHMYGLGEIPLETNTTKILYNNGRGLNGVPLIFAKTNGSFHGLLIDVLEPTEVRIVGGNQVVVRSITNKGLKFHLFLGPTPEDIMKDVMSMLGFKNKVEYWMLGAHICSRNFTETDLSEDFKNFLEEATEAKLPFDSHCGSRPIVIDNDLCGSDYKERVDIEATLLRNKEKKIIPHLSPFIRYEKPNITDNSMETTEDTTVGATENQNTTECTNLIPEFEHIFLKDFNNTDLYYGEVDDLSVIYPDYEYVSNDYMNKIWIDTKVDGVILENSWPLDESYKTHNETYELLPYFSEHFEITFNHTPQWNITTIDGEMYIYTHNQYGNHFAKAFRDMSKKDIPIWTSSERFNGEIINRQNINASWANLQSELNQAALGGISGHWLWSSPICGDTVHYDNERQRTLCAKWYMAATYFPLLNIYSNTIRRDPLSFSGANKINIIKALNRRQSFLPYFYTVLQKGPLLRPMFYQFPSSDSLANLKSQFSVGDDLIIVPDLLPNRTHVVVVMPPGTWYEIWSGLPLKGNESESVLMPTTESDFLTIIRGGSIVVMQKDVEENAERTRKLSDYSLTVALHCKFPVNATLCSAKGTLYMSENMTLNLEANSEILNITAIGDGFNIFCDEIAVWSHIVKEINVFGLARDHNNYDNHKNIQTSIDLCLIKENREIVYSFVG